ncbi:hypothetical protein CEY16_00215 [Halalkalibacillus sediminis]|uniref:N-acetyltransferase domain-containing protein n=1 Tax=Halalkalibacillus sediminis TaxID=2018042 RepID=A0A2I0QV70_9BACI|nr:hypothetical protein [Halalkalibacillus sediminis]PKR78218.1 hypothetical protein CEY16_00215 [Halalkalibacillus sediminis]
MKFDMVTPTFEDIDGMLDLNYRIYPKEWHVSPEYVKEVMMQNPEVYRVCKVNGTVKGVYSLFPLNKKDYEGVLKDEIDEKDLADKVLSYDGCKEVYLYLISIIVDIFDEDYKRYTLALLQDMPEQLKLLESKGIQVKEIGAFAISEDGSRILNRIGFNQDPEIETNEFPVFRSTAPDLIQAIKK